MKTTYLLISFTVCATLSLCSCSKKADDVTPDQSTTPTAQPAPAQSATQTAGKFQVKVDGYLYTPDMNYARTSLDGTGSAGGDVKYFGIYGLDSKTGNLVTLFILEPSGEGTFPINKDNLGNMTVNKYDYSTRYDGTGTVTITRKTATNVEGTFSFTTYDDTRQYKSTLTEGSFNVPITK